YGAYTKLLRSTSSARPHSIPNSPGANPAEPRPRGFGLKVGLTKKVGFAELVPPIRRAYVLALLSFALGLMSKPMLVTVPFLLLLLDFWPLGRFDSNVSIKATFKTLLREKVPFFVLAAISSAITLVVQQKGHATYLEVPIGSRLANAVASYWIYLGKTIWPLHLSIFYPHPMSGSAGSHVWPPVFLALALGGLMVISLAAFRFRRAVPWLMVGWFWFLGSLVPVIGIIQVGGQALADRYTYVPLIGVFIGVTWTASVVGQRWAATKPVWAFSAV